MLAKYTIPFVMLCGALVVGCGDDGSGSTGGTGGTGGSTTVGGGGAGGGGGTTATGGMSTGGAGGMTTSSTTSSTSMTGCQALGDACTACLFDKCNMTYCACYAEPACASLVSCSQGCAGDPACNQGCFTNNQNGISEAALVNDCAATNCAMCPGTAALDPCSKCLFGACPDALSKCLANSECAALVTCAQGCGGDAFCQLGCYDDHPAGQNDADAVSSCAQDSCPGQCG